MCFPSSPAAHPNSLVELLLNLSELMETKLQIGMTFFFFFWVRLLIKNFPSYLLGSSYAKSRRLGWWYRLWNPLSRTGASSYLLLVVINLVKASEWVTEHSIGQILIEHQLYKQRVLIAGGCRIIMSCLLSSRNVSFGWEVRLMY